MFEELIFSAACSQELCRKAPWWDCSAAKQSKQWCFLLLCKATQRHGLSDVHLGVCGALSLSSNCLKTIGAFSLKHWCS